MKIFIKKIYDVIPFKKQIFTAIKFFVSPSQPVYQHLYFNGTIKVKINEQQRFKIIHYGHTIENDIFWKGLFGSWEKNAMKCWAALSAQSNVIFDIGANTGIYSLVAKAVNPQSEVHAFEPFEAIFKKMEKNAVINNYDIHANCMAISNYTGDAVIFTGDANFAYSVTVNKNLWVKDKEPIKLNIKTITLKDYIEQNGITAIDLMKIDVETHEPEVMEGFEDYYNRFKPILLIEILNDEVVEKLNAYFKAAGGLVFFHIDELTGIKEVKELFTSKFYNFLVVPKVKLDFFKKAIFTS